MSRIKSIFAVLCLTAIVGLTGFAPEAKAQTVEVMIAGSSAMWQTLALGAYHLCGAGCYHYTSTGNFNLFDTRQVPAANNDPGAIWIVGDNAGTKFWAYIKVDSVVGVRCYFAVPKCNAQVAAFPAAANTISNALWGDGTLDALPPVAVQGLFTAAAGVTITVGATDIRPEDANFAACRVNSPLGGTKAGTDGLDGLGYSQAAATQLAGDCFKFTTLAQGQINGIGNPIASGYPGSGSRANVLAFALPTTLPKPVDPITGTALQAAYTVTAVGAAPIVFVTARQHNLLGLTTATEQQLQQAFSGTQCDGSAFGAAFAGPLNIFLREPLSGTMNTTEATVFRYPTAYGSLVSPAIEGLSQESNVGANNPLKGQAGTCVAAGNPTGLGARYRAIGTGEEVKSVQNSNAAATFTTAQDGIGYTFFSYGNVNPLKDNGIYGYIKLDGVDPIWAAYGAGTTIDPGEAVAAGQLPGPADLPAGCAGAFPCSEHLIWGNGFSFPNLRNGTYRAWSLLRLIATGTASTNAVALKNASNAFVVNEVPDYVPAAAVVGTTDLGLKLLRSHYQQKDGSNPAVNIGPACKNEPVEAGGDMGGMIIPTTIGVTTETQCSIIQSSNPDGDLSPAKRP